MPKKKATQSRALVPVGETKTYPIATTEIEATQVYHVPARHPRGPGPWEHEADKIAWIDLTTGLPCTILRQPDGVLGGYVGVGEDHPLFGFEKDAVPGALDINPHGGLDYAATCTRGPEETSVCHPGELPRAPHQRPHRDDVGANAGHHPLWWFGFECRKDCDLVPGDKTRNDLGGDKGRVYRDEAYVYTQTCILARQLKAVEQGKRDDGSEFDPSNPSQPVDLHREPRS